MTITVASDPIIKNEFLDFITQNKFNLPSEYIDFILKYNPIRLSVSLIQKDENFYDVSDFYPFTTDEKIYSLQKAISISAKYLPSGNFPFAGSGSGDDFVISMNESDYGKIYLHLSEHDILKLLADSFEEFINGLKLEDEVDL